MAAHADWSHQPQTLSSIRNAFQMGWTRVCVVAPTGAGKTKMMLDAAKLADEKNAPCLILTNRKVILGQTRDEMFNRGQGHRVLAAGHDSRGLYNTTVASVQTMDSRVVNGDTPPPPASLIIIDEAHVNKRDMILSILALYPKAFVIGFTATPVDVGHIYQRIISSASYSLLKKNGVLVPEVLVYAPSEVDMTGLKQSKGEWSQKAMRQRVRESHIFGDVIPNYEKIQADVFRTTKGSYTPTAIFAPGVEESITLAEMFNDAGIPVEHVDGETPEMERRRIFKALRAGDLVGVSSCGVLREGWNAPMVNHAVLLQVAGAISTYIQICGRVLRSHPGKNVAVVQDHTGAWHRHGPPDADRQWHLGWDDKAHSQGRKAALEAGKESEGVRCPKCGHVRDHGPQCPQCGHKHVKSVRHVRTKEGELVRMVGPVVKKKKPPTERELWTRELFAGRHSNRSIRSCVNQFRRRNGRNPDPKEITGSAALPHQSEWGKTVTEVYPWVARR